MCIRFAKRALPLTFAMALIAPIGIPGVGSISLRSASADDEKPTVNSLARDLRKAHRDADYKKGLEIATRLHDLLPDDPRPMYNMACMHALLGDKGSAYSWLERAVEAGYDDASRLANDADFKHLWGESRFRAIVRRIRESAAQRVGDKASATSKPGPNPSAAAKIDVLADLPKVPSLSPAEHAEKQQQLTRELLRVAGSGDHKKALAIALEALAHARAIQDSVGDRAKSAVSLCHYNVACMYSLLKDADHAFAHLDAAVTLGGWSPGELLEQVTEDSDLDNIRKDARFEEVLRRLKAADKPASRRDSVPERDQGKDATQAPAAGPSFMTEEQKTARIEELTPALIQAAEKGDYEKALQYALEAVELADDALTNYNAACMYALNKKKDKSFEHLFRSFEKGGLRGDPVTQLTRDTDLNSLHDDPRWEKALSLARKQRDDRGAVQKDREVPFKYEVTLPPDHDPLKPAALVIAMHHFHGSRLTARDRWAEPAAAVGAILMTPQGTLEAGEDSGMFQWGNDISAVDRNIMGAIDEVMDHHKIDPDRVVIAGFSQGGSMALALALRNPDAFRGVVPVAAMFRPESESAFADEEIKRMHVYLMFGTEDNSQLIASNRKAADLFRGAGATVEVVEFEGLGHGFPRSATAELTKALKAVLP
ncbi:MAG: dienelactone hydrolase family protein [Phycisphaerae bacterium]|nr:dienelactone hydrolase family protein [Phycisphaerae bacterium]